MAVDISPSQFIGKLQGGGARNNLFRILINFPALPGINGAQVSETTSLMGKAAVIPSSQLGVTELPFQGRIVKIHGDKIFDEWTVSIFNDTDFAVRDAFEIWLNAINTHEANTGLQATADYFVDAKVEQLDRNGEIIKTYNMKSIWPSTVGEIQLDWSTNNAVEEFPVTFQINWWTSNTTDGQ